MVDADRLGQQLLTEFNCEDDAIDCIIQETLRLENPYTDAVGSELTVEEIMSQMTDSEQHNCRDRWNWFVENLEFVDDDSEYQC